LPVRALNTSYRICGTGSSDATAFSKDCRHRHRAQVGGGAGGAGGRVGECRREQVVVQ
jgi:hypothetical protein